jgi:hypothetical protein
MKLFQAFPEMLANLYRLPARHANRILLTRNCPMRIPQLIKWSLVLGVSLPCVSVLIHASVLSVRIVDETGKITPARAWVDAGSQRLFEPSSPDTVTPYARDRSFSCDGLFEIEVPAGAVVVHVEKGKEYRSVDIPLNLKAGETVTRIIKLKRWIDMPSEGWYSADLHVHLGQDDPRILKQLALADDVHLIPAFTYWLRGKGETWETEWPDSTYTKPIIIDDHHVISRNNLEIERIDREAIPGGSVGATFLYNLTKPVSVELNGEHFPTDAALCRLAQAHSPQVVIDSDKPSWAETVIGVALGAMDTIQLCHNHFHRESTITGGWGMIGPLAPGESNSDVGDGLFHRTNDLYYRFLNCGFRLGVSGGSAIGVMPVATGQHRVYAKLDGNFTAENYWKAIKEGRSFVTSGPMLDLVANGKGMGATLSMSSKNRQRIQVHATVRSIDHLEALQIVRDGRVVAFRNLMKDKSDSILERELNFEIAPDRSGWIAARALFRAPDGLLRQAHTSPIYITVDNKPTVSADDARYMLRWVEILDEITRTHPERFPTTQIQKAVLADYSEARKKYLDILKDAQRYWRD